MPNLTKEDYRYVLVDGTKLEPRQYLKDVWSHIHPSIQLTLGKESTLGINGPVRNVLYADLLLTGPDSYDANRVIINNWILTVDVTLPKYMSDVDSFVTRPQPFTFTITDPVKRSKTISTRANIDEVVDVYKQFCTYAETENLDVSEYQRRIVELEKENKELKKTIAMLQDKFPKSF